MLVAEQLKAAHGNVRCGTCLESFDAIPHLSDGPLPSPPAAGADSPVETSAQSADQSADDTGARPMDRDPLPGNARSASERLSSTLDALRAAAAGDAPADDNQSPGSAPGGAQATADETGKGRDDGDDEEPAETSEAPVANTAPPKRVALLDDGGEDAGAELPEVLRADAQAYAARIAARRRAIGYGAAAIVLVVLLAAQYLFFMPEDAARRYPLFRGAIESVCVEIGCVLPERRDPSRIRVLSRDVRVHPRYEGVMQIKATLTNAAPFRQPYPQVRFTLFNVNGQTIATRVFQPSEYLGRPVAASARLRPKTPFQVELDVLAPGEAAVSFEFSFL